jgi:hypothetical protein
VLAMERVKYCNYKRFIKKININDLDYKSFIETSKKKVVQYYDLNAKRLLHKSVW